MAWCFENQHVYTNEKGGLSCVERLLTNEEKLTKRLADMERVVEDGEVLCSGGKEWLGDEDRYRREREERERRYAELDAELERRLAEAEAEGHDGKEAKLIAFGRIVQELQQAVA